MEGNQDHIRDQFESMFGSTPKAEHAVGETIQFLYNGASKTGKIVGIRPPGQAVQGGKVHALTYWVYTGEGMPVPVYQTEIIEG